ncbi:PAS domain-containing protein [Pedobacter mucosus]|uniref:PAS domain-containing protein n=1 Tax=Pedobacter mucosus TaxID=2895286 RepID=UPI001EE49E8A|nr:PAS domain-containing protein [Pedobacter mucosus]UKT66137.1 PAS domain-containing protein [Pedobacter mucosus]
MINSYQLNNFSSIETDRLAALKRYKIANTQTEKAFDDLAKLTCGIFGVPISLITFIDEQTVCFKANVGFGNETSEPRKYSICDQTLQSDGVTVVEDVHQIPKFVGNEFGIRFYAGAPLVTSDGHKIGTICIMDYQPSEFDGKKQEILIGLAEVTMDRVELRLNALNDETLKIDNQKILSVNKEISAQNSNLIDFQAHIAEANNVLEEVLDSFEMIFKQTPMPMGICSSESNTIWQANEAFIQTFGTNDFLIGSKLDTLFSGTDDVDLKSIIRDVHQNKIPYHATGLKLMLNQADGSRGIYVNISLQPVGRMGDEPDNIMFILTDVTDQIISKQLTQEANLVLLNALEATRIGYTVVNFETGKMTSNNQMKNNYGFLSEEDFNYSDLFHAILPKYEMKIKRMVQQAIKTKGLYEAEYEVQWRDGSIHWIRAFGKPVYNANGEATHIIGFNQIITKSK